MTMALLLSRFLLFKLLLASTHAFVTRLHSFTLPVKLSSLQAGTSADEGEHVSIEYCTGCRWMLRSTWLAQELLTTFQQELDSVALVPSRPPAPGGVFIVTCKDEVLWDRKEEGGFPESKELKQRVRNIVAPERFLGHSDSPERQQYREDCVDCENESSTSIKSTTRDSEVQQDASIVNISVPTPNVAITYCTGCRWLLRAAWIAQELLTTFETEIASITLIPSRPPAKGGIFTVTLDHDVLWDRTEKGRFPQPKELKQMIRDRVAPSKDLGHSDVVKQDDSDNSDIDLMDDDEAADMRSYFGVM